MAKEVKKAGDKKKAGGNTFKGGVHVAAKLERANYQQVAIDNGYGYGLRNLYLDLKGNLIAEAGCSETFVCRKSEIGTLVDFLNEVAEV